VPTSSETTVADALVTLPDDVDLHARPAADFVRTAMRFPCDVWVAAGEREVDAKSLLSVLALGAKGGTSLRLRAHGAEARAALQALAGAVAGLN
jgi:phosphotransferase system HPr (HPr) family protein